MADQVNIYDKDARLAVYAMTEWEGKRKSGTRFDRVGTAFVNRDGSLNIQLDLLPAQGQKLHVRPVQQRDDRGEQHREPPRGPDGSGEGESSGQPF